MVTLDKRGEVGPLFTFVQQVASELHLGCLVFCFFQSPAGRRNVVGLNTTAVFFLCFHAVA